MGALTVRENIAFSAALRLPSKYKWKDRKYKVDEILEEVGLTEVAENKVILYKEDLHTTCEWLI